MVQVLRFVQWYWTWFQAGVIGHVPLTNKVTALLRLVGVMILSKTYQVGAQYEVRPDVDLNVYYGYDNIV